MNSKMPRKRVEYLFAFYFLFAFVLVLSATFSRREYQDSWILEGLFIPTLLFSLAFLVVAVNNVKSNAKLVLLIASFLALLTAIPNLKYVQIHGVYDSIAHYGYTNRLISSGYVPQTGFYAKEYSGTPGMHIFLATIALITGMSTALSIKLFLVAISLMVPFSVYFVTKNAFSKDVRSFILLALCLSLPISYSLVGTTFALPIYFIFISVLLRQTLETQPPRQFSLILITLGTGLIISHGVTSLFLSLLMFCTLFMLKISEFVKKGSPRLVPTYLYVSIFLAVSLFTWWSFSAKNLFFDFLIGMLKSLLLKRSTVSLPSKFYQLLPSEQLTLVFVRFYDILVILTLGFVGFIVYVATLRKQYLGKTRTLYLQILCILCATALIAVPFFSRLQTYTFERFVTYSLLLSPFFVGLSLYGLFKYLAVCIKRPIVRNFSFALLLFMLLVPSLLVKFPCQPLLPRNNENEYIVDYRSVNTVYQVAMIDFAESHYVNGSIIASDIATSWQIFGLTDISFSSGYSWNNPLYENNTQGDMILLHYSGISGPLNEKVEYRTRTRLNEFKFKLGNQIVYDNGESFIIVPNN